MISLVEADGFTHGGLQEERLDVLPVLFQKRNQEVDRQHDVVNKLILIHLDVSNGNTQTQDLFQLELDGSLELSDLLFQVLGVGDRRGEFTSLGETRTQDTGNLLDQSLGSQESIVFLGCI